MSYDIDLCDPVTGKVIELEHAHMMRGGIYPAGGIRKLSFNVTYNYAPFFRKTLDKDLGIRVLYGKIALNTIPMLEKAISELGNDVSNDYWDATEGNAKQALISLLTMAKMRPDGVWQGD